MRKITSADKLGAESVNALAESITAVDVGAYAKNEVDAALGGKADILGFTLISADVDLHTLPGGRYYVPAGGTVSTANNWPYTGWFTGYILVLRHDNEINSHGSIVCVNETLGSIYKQDHLYTVWQEWQKIATATPPTEYDLPLAAGVKLWDGFCAKYRKNQFGEVGIIVNAEAVNTIARGTVIATLPAGYCPTSRISVPCVYAINNANTVGTFDVSVAGGIFAYPTTSLQPGDKIVLTASFVATP